VAGDEQVTSPDQHRPTVSRKWARTGAIVSIAALVAMARWGNREGHVEDFFLYGIAGVMLLMLIGDVILRRKGLRGD
jgi:hypothetical protein